MSDVEIDWEGVDSQASKTIGSTYWGGIWTSWVVGATYIGVELALELKTRLLFALGVIFVEVFMVSVVATVVLVLGN